MLGGPMFGYDLGYQDPNRRRAVLERMGELAVYPAVGKLQRQLNYIKTLYPAWAPGADIGTDGRYGSGTHARLKSLIGWAARQVAFGTGCSATGTDELDRSGPSAVQGCIQYAIGAFTVAELTQIQTAWREWKTGLTPGGGGVDPYAAAKTTCAASGGTWNSATNTCTPAGAPPPPPASSSGMSTGEWILLIALGAAVAGGIYYVATE